MTRRHAFATAAALVALGAGAAYVSPPFAAACKSAWSACAAWTGRQVAAVERAYKKTSLSASVDRELKQREADKQQKQREAAQAKAKPASKSAAKPKPPSAAELRRQERASWTPGQRIANGRTFAKQKEVFGFTSVEQMAAQVDRVVSYASASNTKTLDRGRTAYWDEQTRAIVIVDPDSADGGTLYKPKPGRRAFEELK